MLASRISICALTFRRPRELARLFKGISRLKRPNGFALEVVIVDNDPARSAIDAPNRMDAIDGIPVHWHHEVSGVLARARNLAISSAEGDWLALVDDDEVPHENWLLEYAEISESFEVDGFLGPVVPRLESSAPAVLAFEPFFTRARHPSGADVPVASFRTSNVFARRALFRDVMFDPGFVLPRGEDSDFFLRASEAGARFVWCDAAIVDEFIPPERCRMRYLSRLAFDEGRGCERIRSRRVARGFAASLARALLRIVAAAVWLAPASLAGREALMHAWLRVCRQVGRAYAILRPTALEPLPISPA